MFQFCYGHLVYRFAGLSRCEFVYLAEQSVLNLIWIFSSFQA